MDRNIGNKLSLKELSQLEELAHRSPTCNSRVVLRLAAALREALQEKENARALARVYRRRAEKARTQDSVNPLKSISTDTN